MGVKNVGKSTQKAHIASSYQPAPVAASSQQPTKNLDFSRISDDTLGTFLAWFWHSLVLQSPGVFPPGGDFFEPVLLLAAASNRIYRKIVFF